jgi:predicted PurR-regulated permease PerM
MNNKSELYFLLALLIGVLVLTFFIFKPFLYALLLAIVFATVFNPLHKRMLALTRQKISIAAILSTFVILVLVIVPLTLLATQIFKEATELYSYLAGEEGSVVLANGIENALGTLGRYLPIPDDVSLEIGQYTRQGLNWLLPHLGSFVSNTAKVAMSVFIFLISLYYMFKDGPKLRKTALALSPLEDSYDETIFGKLKQAINAVVKGNLTIALIQGALSALGFIIFGIPSALLWGCVAAIAAVIPGFGTAIVIVPAVLFLFFSGEPLPALGLLIWGIVAVGLVDNFLGPKLVERGMRIHPLLILLSILGGLALFGPLGFILGPLVLSLLFALVEIYFTVRKKQEATQS